MIEFKNVSKTYDNGTKSLKDVSLCIEDGEFVFIVGASGAGKSTLLKILMREEVPSGGTVTINNYNLNTLKKREIPYFRRTLGIVFQDYQLFDNKTVEDNLLFVIDSLGYKPPCAKDEYIAQVLDRVGIPGKSGTFPHMLSGGEKQRVAIARALINNPSVVGGRKTERRHCKGDCLQT